MYQTKAKWIITVCKADLEIAADDFLSYQNKIFDSSQFPVVSKSIMFKKLVEGIETTFFKNLQFWQKSKYRYATAKYHYPGWY